MNTREEATPQDTSNVFHLPYSTSLETILDKVKERWGEGQDLNNVEISAVHFHARCITYDLYDPSDWDDYVVVTKVGS